MFGPEQVTALADFVVCHPTAATYVNSYGQSGDAAKKVAAKKVKKYGALATQLGYKFIPFAVNEHGGIGPQADDFIDSLVSLGPDRVARKTHLMRRIAAITAEHVHRQLHGQTRGTQSRGRPRFARRTTAGKM